MNTAIANKFASNKHPKKIPIAYSADGDQGEGINAFASKLALHLMHGLTRTGQWGRINLLKAKLLAKAFRLSTVGNSIGAGIHKQFLQIHSPVACVSITGNGFTSRVLFITESCDPVLRRSWRFVAGTSVCKSGSS